MIADGIYTVTLLLISLRHFPAWWHFHHSPHIHHCDIDRLYTVLVIFILSIA